MPSFAYASAGKFYRVDRDDASGEITSITEVTAEQAVPLLIDNYLHGSTVNHPEELKVGEKPTGARSTAGDFVRHVLSPAFEQIYSRKNLSMQQRYELIHKTFGDSPEIVRLVSMRFSEDIAREIWGDRAVRYTQNDSPSDEPAAQPANVIQDVRSQGTGPVPANVAPRDEPWALTEQSTSTSPRDNPRTGGDPLILFSGQLIQEARDLVVPARGLHFEFVRTYLNQTVYKGPLGYSWDHSYNLWIREEQELLPDGLRENVAYRSTGRLREDRYVQILGVPTAPLAPLTDTPAATFRAPAGFFDRLEKIGGTYVLFTVDGTRFEYNADNFVARIIDPNGNMIQFQYQGTLLTQIIDPVGKVYQLAYDELNRISVLTDITGERRVIYKYGDNGDLDEVDILHRDAIVTGVDYRYLGPDVPRELQHSLSEVIDALGNSTLQVMYGDDVGSFEFNRVVQQRSGEGDFLYEYDSIVPEFNVDPMADELNLARSITRVQHPNGHIVEHWFNGQGNVVRRVERVLLAPTGPQTLVSDYRYNEDGLLVEEARPDGARVHYRYQREAFADLHGGDTSTATPEEARCFGNLLKRIEVPRPALGDTRRIVTDFSYEQGTTRLARQVGPYYANLSLSPLPGQTIGDISYGYDAVGNLVRISSPPLARPDGSLLAPQPHVFTYDAFGSITGVTTGNVRTEYVYFSDTPRSGFVRLKIEDANGVRRRTTYDVDSLGRAISVQDPYGAVIETDFTPFDAPGVQRLPPVVEGGTAPVVTWTYDRALRLTSIVETLRRFDDSLHPDAALVQTFKYDACGRLIEQRFGTPADPRLIARRTTYTPWGAVEREFNFNGVQEYFRYNERGLLASVTAAAGRLEEATQRHFYNSSGEIVRIRDGRGFETITERDAFGRAARVRDPRGTILEIEYDAVDRPLTRRLRGIEPVNGNTVLWCEIEYRYDAAGRVIERLDSLFEPQSPAVPTRRLPTQYWYNALGFLERTTDGGSTLETYERDGLGRVTIQRDAAGNETRFTYDDNARTLTITDIEVGDPAAANVTQICRRVLEYDHRNLAVREIDAFGNVVSKAYDSRRLEERRIDPSGVTIESRYDVLGRLIEQESSAGTVPVRAATEYDPNGNALRINTPAGGEVRYTYDARDRVVEQHRIS
jgi:YD repeat-containing protein